MNTNPYDPNASELQSSENVDRRTNIIKVRLGLLVAGLHASAVALFTYSIHLGLQRSGEAAGAWVIWLVLDFPISLGIIPIASLCHGGPLSLNISYANLYTIVYGTYFMLAGGLQYYFLGRWISGYLIRKSRSSNKSG